MKLLQLFDLLFAARVSSPRKQDTASLATATAPELPPGQVEARKLLHTAALEDYSAVRTEIMTMLVEYRKVLNMAVVSLPLIVSIWYYAVQQKLIIPAFFMYLGSLFYTVLCLYVLRHLWSITALAKYIRENCVPTIRSNIRALAEAQLPEASGLMSWEELGPSLNKVTPWLTPLDMSTLGIPLLPSICLLCLGFHVEWPLILQLIRIPMAWRLDLSVGPVLRAVASFSFLYLCFAAISVRLRIDSPRRQSLENKTRVKKWSVRWLLSLLTSEF